ncbi:MAG TPA: anti-sigma factor [Sphingopyxis sp.]|mgnify:CR=1 FL=1|nr:anti-sigma factor [Sphingopyxis sp.]
MTHDPATIAAFVDGDLDDLTARRIAREAESDAALAAEIARHRGLRETLAVHYAPVLDEAVPDRLRALLSDAAPVDTSLAARREAKRLRFAPAHWGAVAAALVLGLTVGLKPWTPAGPVAVEGGMLIAAGPLAEALDTQLASNQASGGAVRIGLTFRDGEGRICRSFESAAIDGIGCRRADGWTLEHTLGGSAAGEYRQASSGALAALAAGMMADEPLDAAGEKAAREGGWR